MAERPTPEQLATWLRDPRVHHVAVPSGQSFCGTPIHQHKPLREVAADALDALRAERDALASWSCAECGARFGTPIPQAPMMDGVTRCSKCAESEFLRGRVATLTAERDDALADAGVLAADLSLMRQFVDDIRAFGNGCGCCQTANVEETMRSSSKYAPLREAAKATDSSGAISRHGGVA